jgi:hypothetical protein
MFTWRLQLSPEVNDVPFICWHPASDFIEVHEVTWRLELIHEVNGVPLICWCHAGLRFNRFANASDLWRGLPLICWCPASMLFLWFTDASDLLEVGGEARLWSAGVLLVYGPMDLPMQTICLMLMVWPAVPSTCRCKRELWARFNLASCPSIHVLLVLHAC